MSSSNHFAADKEYIKVSSYEAKKGEFSRCLLLYSGGLDTSVMLKWIQTEYNADVIALTINIGQTADDLTAIQNKAKQLGAVEAIVIDGRKQFADKYLSMAIKANADYQGGYALGCPLGRVIISEIAVSIAKQYRCQVIAHGCTGKGNDQVRFEGYILSLEPTLKIIAPVREWGMGREEELDYAAKHNIPVKQKKDSPYSYDENMWSNTGEGGEIENPEVISPVHNILQWCNTPEQAPDKSEKLVIGFDKGVPVSLNNENLELYELIARCNSIGSTHGVGVVQLIEDRIVGLKVRGIYENPGAAILISAHKKLEMLTSTRDENEFKTIIDQKWAYNVYGAKYFENTTRHVEAYINDQNQKVTGSVTVELYKGNITVVSLSSPYSLFNQQLATFERTQGLGTFNQNVSSGFIELYTMAMRTSYNVNSIHNKQAVQNREQELLTHVETLR